MSHPENTTVEVESIQAITEFVDRSSGLDAKRESEVLSIRQVTDGKVLRIFESCIEEVLTRFDSEGQSFLQVNFNDGRKILLTEKLVGFKPAHCRGLDMEKLPRVVTTPDLVSVVEAIEESLALPDGAGEEVEVLRKVFDSVLAGAEDIGFSLTAERTWLTRLLTHSHKASA